MQDFKKKIKIIFQTGWYCLVLLAAGLVAGSNPIATAQSKFISDPETDEQFLGYLLDLSFLKDFPWNTSFSILEDEKIKDEDFDNGADYTPARPWRKPKFSRHEDFIVPEAIRPIVEFWVDIYSKYSNNQGVLHDMENPDLILDVIDFNDIESDPKQGPIRRELNRKQRVKNRKSTLMRSLAKLARKKVNFDKLSENEKHIYNYFKSKNDLKELRNLNKSDRIRFQLGQKDRMQTAIYYSGRYLENIEKIFEEAGVPLELSRLPFVESSFNIFAYSKVGASGIWQVMPSSSSQSNRTRVYFDLRNYPIPATRMATKVLRQGYKLTGSWSLAAIGYNHGPSGVRRKVEKLHTKNIGDLLSKHKKAFGFASRNFYPCLLAVIEVEGHAKKYFKNVQWSERLPSISYTLPVGVKYEELLNWYNGNNRKVQVYNPHLTPLVRKKKMIIPAGTPLEIPQNLAANIQSELETRRIPRLPHASRRKVVSNQSQIRKYQQ